MPPKGKAASAAAQKAKKAASGTAKKASAVTSSRAAAANSSGQVATKGARTAPLKATEESSAAASAKRPRTVVAAAAVTPRPPPPPPPPPAELPKKASRREPAAAVSAAEPEKNRSDEVVQQDAPVQLSLTHSLLKRYLPRCVTSASESAAAAAGGGGGGEAWNVRDAVVFSTFLATLQTHLVRGCCRVLARLTTATTPAFLHAAALGEAALHATTADDTPAVQGSARLPDVDQLVDRQEVAYRTMRATIAASCTLGHRSCQVLWGPRGSGKHRILRLLAQEVRRTANTFVVELHGALLRDDEAALGVIAQQLLSFLLSPASLSLRQGHYLLRTGTFGFGQLFHFERRLQEAAGASDSFTVNDRELTTGKQQQPPPRVAGTRAGKRAAAFTTTAADDTEDEDGGEEEEEEEEGNADMMVTSTTTFLTGGASSALPHLQRALLLLKSQGCNIVVCIRDIDLFGIRCDQLLYVLSGLMHDSEGGGHGGEGGGGSNNNINNSGGGLSLVLASAAPDIRQIEKRLSSRLTCETRYVPLLPWSLPGLMAATLHLVQQDASTQLQLRELTQQRAEVLGELRDGAVRLRRVCEEGLTAADGGGGGGGRRSAVMTRGMRERIMQEVQDSMAGLEARLHATEAALRDVRAQRRHNRSTLDLDTAGGGGGLDRRSSSSSSVAAAVVKSVLDISPGGGAGASESLSGWRWQPVGDSSVSGGGAAAAARPAAPALSASISQQSAASSSSVVTARTWTVAALLAHPSLSLELQSLLCEEVLHQLRSGKGGGGGGDGQPTYTLGSGNGGPSSSSSSSPVAAGAASTLTLAQRIIALGEAVEMESGTGATVLTVLSSALCKTASGALDLLGVGGRRLLLRWMRARLQHEAIPLSSDSTAVAGRENVSACPPGLPARVLMRWRAAAQALAPPPPPPSSSGNVEATKAGASAELHGPFRLDYENSSTGISSDGGVDESGGAGCQSRGATTTTALVAAPPAASLPPLSLLPPHLFDLFSEGQLVGMGYGSREVMLVLFSMHLHHTTGVRQRTVSDLLEDVSSSLGTRAAAALDREAFRHAIRLLCRWRLLTMVERHSQVVQLCGSDARLREFLAAVLAKQTAWCEAELGLDAREIMRFRNLV